MDIYETAHKFWSSLENEDCAHRYDITEKCGHKRRAKKIECVGCKYDALHELLRKAKI